jgi:hypothetical protein
LAGITDRFWLRGAVTFFLGMSHGFEFVFNAGFGKLFRSGGRWCDLPEEGFWTMPDGEAAPLPLGRAGAINRIFKVVADDPYIEWLASMPSANRSDATLRSASYGDGHSSTIHPGGSSLAREQMWLNRCPSLV